MFKHAFAKLVKATETIGTRSFHSTQPKQIGSSGGFGWEVVENESSWIGRMHTEKQERQKEAVEKKLELNAYPSNLTKQQLEAAEKFVSKETGEALAKK